jgi:hypothetical protein
MNNNNNNCHH